MELFPNRESLEDIKKLYDYLREKRAENVKSLSISFSYCAWLSLAEATLTSVHVFNRRRAGEIERVFIEDFQSYEKLNRNMYSDIYKSLSSEHRKIAEKYIRFSIRGKLGRIVPVLLSKDLFHCIKLILKFRKEAEVPDKNPYVFGLPGGNKQRYRYLRACALLRKFAIECNAMHSATLRGTILRKHIATYCIQLNLNDIDISDLATFMGHSDKIHKDHYRQPLASRDILKISQFLEAVQGGEQIDESSSHSNEDKDDEVLKDNLKNNSFADNDINKGNISSQVTIFLFQYFISISQFYVLVFLTLLCCVYIHLLVQSLLRLLDTHFGRPSLMTSEAKKVIPIYATDMWK